MAVPAGVAGDEQRRERPRRVNALLNAYYSLPDGSSPPGAEPAVSSRDSGKVGSSGCDLDRQGFDAKRYFDSMLHSGRLPDVAKRSTDLDAEVHSLDAEMQKLVYENYTHFTRAAGVISRMKVCLESLEPDIQNMEGRLTSMTKYEDQAESGVANNGQQLERVLQRRQLCQKLEVLFGLPAMLSRCLDQGTYDLAARAYNSCAGFLAHHRDLAALDGILQETEQLISSVKEVLQERLRSRDVPVQVAVHDACTLLSLVVDLPQATECFSIGRASALQEILEECFASGDATDGPHDEADVVGAAPGVEVSRQEQDMRRPESVALQRVFSRITLRYMPCLGDALDGLHTLRSEAQKSSPVGVPSGAVAPEFAAARLSEVFQRLISSAQSRRPPTRVLVQCVRSLSEALQPLELRVPSLRGLFVQFCGELAESATAALFASGATAAVAELVHLNGRCSLHGSCGSVSVPEAGDQDPGNMTDDILEDVAKAEHALIMSGFTAISECQPLLGLLEGDTSGTERLVHTVQNHLVGFFLVLVDLCLLYVGQEQAELRHACGLVAIGEGLAAAEVAVFSTLPWCGLFGLALVRMARHFEVKVIGKVWAVAHDMFSASVAAVALTPPPVLVRLSRCAAQAVVNHYTLVAGHVLAVYFREAFAGRDWLSTKEPRDVYLPARVVREMRARDAQLALVLGDPRRDKERRPLSLLKNAMELEMERMLAKKLQAFAPSPFNRNGVEVGILKIGFKALYELARESTFGKFGLQQIQVDCALLSAFVQDFVDADDSGALCSLLGETVSSASQRCSDPELMASAMVEALCEDKRRELKLC